MSIVTVGIDLAKDVFAVHGVDAAGKALLVKPRVTRDQLAMPLRTRRDEASGTGSVRGSVPPCHFPAPAA